jgi:hypothetical protein
VVGSCGLGGSGGGECVCRGGMAVSSTVGNPKNQMPKRKNKLFGYDSIMQHATHPTVGRALLGGVPHHARLEDDVRALGEPL